MSLPELRRAERWFKRKGRKTGAEWMAMVDFKGRRHRTVSGSRNYVEQSWEQLLSANDYDWFCMAHNHTTPGDWHEWINGDLSFMMTQTMIGVSLIIEPRQTILLVREQDARVLTVDSGRLKKNMDSFFLQLSDVGFTEAKAARMQTLLFARIGKVAVYVGGSVHKMKRKDLTEREEKLLRTRFPWKKQEAL